MRARASTMMEAPTMPRLVAMPKAAMTRLRSRSGLRVWISTCIGTSHSPAPSPVMNSQQPNTTKLACWVVMA